MASRLDCCLGIGGSIPHAARRELGAFEQLKTVSDRRVSSGTAKADCQQAP